MQGDLATLVADLRGKVPPTFDVYTGAYLEYSSIGWMKPGPFYDLVERAVPLYDTNTIQGQARRCLPRHTRTHALPTSVRTKANARVLNCLDLLLPPRPPLRQARLCLLAHRWQE